MLGVYIYIYVYMYMRTKIAIVVPQTLAVHRMKVKSVINTITAYKNIYVALGHWWPILVLILHNRSCATNDSHIYILFVSCRFVVLAFTHSLGLIAGPTISLCFSTTGLWYNMIF